PDASLSAANGRHGPGDRPAGARRHRLAGPARADQRAALAGLRADDLPALRTAPSRPAAGRADHCGVRAAAGRPPDAPHGLGGVRMTLLANGCNYPRTAVELRERLAFDGDKLQQALQAITSRLECEAVILSTCNRVELYLAGEACLAEPVVSFLGEFHTIPAE